jgi:tetratricopeptide (TPR) repeat protein
MRTLLVSTLIALTIVMVAGTWWNTPRSAKSTPAGRLAPLPSTSRAELVDSVETLRRRIADRPDDGEAVVRLAQLLVRVQRVNAYPGAATEAEQHLRRFLSRQPDHYASQRELASVLLSQHRYRDAIAEAQKARTIDPRDALNYGVIGDSYLELGQYEEAFAAFDRMGAERPGPPAYARVSYALELKGDLDGALDAMRMAAESTSAHDAEAQSWLYAQIGNLLLQKGHLGDARREFERAAATFPRHPYAQLGLARIKLATGDYQAALVVLTTLFAEAPTPELAFMIGDLQRRHGDPAASEAMYVQGEQLERDGWKSEEPQPQALARFLAERNRDITEAIALAEEAASKRNDIHTMDALAWAYFQAGRLPDAQRATEAAIRTGTRDARVLAHAAAIRLRQGDAVGARALLARAAVPLPDVMLLDGNIEAVRRELTMAH